MFDLNSIIVILTIPATAVMAASAATQAVRFDFDLFGATFLAVITAVGGGTIRDILIGATPVFWLRDITYLCTAVPVGIITYLMVARMQGGQGQRFRLLSYFDAVGLALFTLVGVKVALNAGINPIMAAILGGITGVGGGMLRDVLCGVTPTILKSDFYATLSLIGAALYLFSVPHLGEEISLASAFALITVVRIAIVARNAT
ncbi:membrane protein [Amylibacter ulvae]|uniref:Membrane protein n=1 Tax=Paramylibacter ulvae TaxID=1651968 RepID=A0ABQ3D660_9RHOB|nr:TRIC cation channel family protein [Amylibacter ulvae]GHA58786.1 membrane protein [Amylibacter ulvae]